MSMAEWHETECGVGLRSSTHVCTSYHSSGIGPRIKLLAHSYKYTYMAHVRHAEPVQFLPFLGTQNNPSDHRALIS